MNILCVGDKLPMQRGFFKNNAGDLLPALSFLRWLYNTVFFGTNYLPSHILDSLQNTTKTSMFECFNIINK